MAATIGIDLGTTKSCVAVFDDRGPTIVRNPEGDRTTPSAVAVSEHDRPLVGVSAMRQAVTNPGSIITSALRLMGRKEAEIDSEARIARYRIVSGDHGDALVDVGGTQLSPPEICAMILHKLKADAEAYLKQKVDRAVLTAPPSFNQEQRRALYQACRLAGLEVARLVNGPTAVALAFGFNRPLGVTMLVVDVGGGSVKAAVIEAGDGFFDVLSTAGDGHVGGDDFDKIIVDWLLDHVRASHGVDVTSDPVALQRLYEAAQRAKIELSSVEHAEVAVPYLAVVGGEPVDLNARLTRKEFDDLSTTLLERVVAPLRQVVKDAEHLAHEPIGELLLVGGMSRMPALRAKVHDETGLAPQPGIDVDEAPVLGAAIQAGIMGHEVAGTVLEVNPLTLGVEAEGGAVTALIPRNIKIPRDVVRELSKATTSQSMIELHVLQGESSAAAENKSLGRIQVAGLTPMGGGAVETHVHFSIDANGIVSVSAKDPRSGAAHVVSGLAGSTLVEP